jgi:hypothetical protein
MWVISFLVMGIKPPVIRPGIIEYVEDDIQVLLKVLFANSPGLDTFFRPFDDQLHDSRGFDAGIDEVRQEILFLQVTALSQPRRIIRVGMTHHHRRFRIKSIDQQTTFLVDRQVERSPDRFHALAAQPVFRSPKDCLEGLSVVFRLQHPEKSCAVLVAVEMQSVDLGTDTSYRAAVPKCYPATAGCVIKIRIVRGEKHALL